MPDTDITINGRKEVLIKTSGQRPRKEVPMTEQKRERGERWGKHMQIPEIRETLFELSKQLNPPKRDWKDRKPKK